MLKNLSLDKLHHTNVCVGDRKLIIEDIDILVSKLSKSVSKVEKLYYDFDKFLIKDSKNIFSRHIHKVGEDEIQIIVIAFNFTNQETQNSMLKILEEPPKRAYFFLVVPNNKILFQTILSRSQIFQYENIVDISKETTKFINSSYEFRLNYVKDLLEEIKKETKTKQDAINFIEEVEKHLFEKKEMQLLKKIIKIKDYFKEHGSSAKQLLEYIAVVIPL